VNQQQRPPKADAFKVPSDISGGPAAKAAGFRDSRAGDSRLSESPAADKGRLRVADSRGSESATAPARLVLASTSEQRRAILGQLQIPFEVVTPAYEEHDPPGADPVRLVLDHAEGKARSVHADGRVTLGVDTTVHLDGEIYGKPEDEVDAARTLRRLAGRTHIVLSGVCLLGPGFAALEHTATEVSFRELSPGAVEAYLASGEWRGRAGAYAIQGLGGRLVERIDGDYLNVVGLPGATLVRLLERHAPGLLGVG
jgi:septum formation protein